ncbi:uncharacterized protein [Clinocottus analis]|uniref:uncharacterized protein n=1 Tax=Clinocottus analis TaxID=304258 RepID=UPI0035BEBAA7
MMRMSGIFTMCCGALLLAVTSVLAVPKLQSINGLKKISFGQSVPKHSLLLLYWFANTVDIDENNVIWLTFDPNREDYGSHHYGNYEGLLEPLHRNNPYRYYTIGNLNQETSMPLPPYVVSPPATEYVGSNMDRIIIRVSEPNTGLRVQQMIDQVYMTQHYDFSVNMGTVYDPDHTYMITTHLMRQIREFSVGRNQLELLQLRNRFGSNVNDSWLRHIIKTWTPNLAGLGLLLYIVIQEKDSSNQPRKTNRQEKRQNHVDDSSEPESNTHRNVYNQSCVVVLDDDVDHEANRTTGNRQSCFDSVPQNRRKLCYCCIAILCLITIISSIGIFLHFYLR